MTVFAVCFVLLFLLGLLFMPVALSGMSKNGPFARTHWRKTVVLSLGQALLLATIAAIWVD